MIKLLIFSFILCLTANAGLPPTTGKVSSDSSDVTTFKYQFPNFTGTHTGTSLSLDVNSIAGGGTGQATKTPAFDALQPMSAAGDIIYGGASGTGTRLPIGSSNQVLTVVAGAPAWSASGGSGGSTIEAKFTLSDAVVPYTNIAGPHYQVNTKTLSLVNLTMLDSGTQGLINPILTAPGASTGFSTVVRINQWHTGLSTVFATGCAAIPGNKTANSGGPSSVAATVSSCTTWAAAPMSLAIGDIMSVDVVSVGPSTFPYGTPSDLTLEY